MPGGGGDRYPVSMKLHTLSRLERNGRTALVVAALAIGFGGAARAQEALVQPAVARPVEMSRETRTTATLSPSSALDARAAFSAAWTIASQIQGARVMTVLPTGSMRPMFDQKAFLVVAPVAFESVQVGDIITFRHPKLGTPIVHRVFEKHGKSLWTKGDHNSRPDDVYVTAENYECRVLAVIYAGEDTAALRRPARTS